LRRDSSFPKKFVLALLRIKFFGALARRFKSGIVTVYCGL
jgi:hypothetical protein